jgi:hypothetical protein
MKTTSEHLAGLHAQRWESAGHRESLAARLEEPVRRGPSRARIGLVAGAVIAAAASAGYVAYTRTASISFDGDRFTITEDGKSVSGTATTNPDGSKTVIGDDFKATVSPVAPDGQRQVSVELDASSAGSSTITTPDGKVVRRVVQKPPAPK